MRKIQFNELDAPSKRLTKSGENEEKSRAMLLRNTLSLIKSLIVVIIICQARGKMKRIFVCFDWLHKRAR